MVENKFSFFYEKEYSIYILDKVEKEILNIKDVKAQKKILQSLKRLTARIPNKPEMWEAIKGCEGINVYELKPKPYRLGCYKSGRYILVVHIWRVQKGKGSKKRNDINKACEIAKEVKDEFERFVRRI